MRPQGPLILPANWQEIAAPPMRDPGRAYRSDDGLCVMVSQAIELDSRQWLHVSMSRAQRLPSWVDLRTVKDLFVGRDRKAIQVLPPAAEYVNLHPFVLHLWACLEADDPLPDFTHGTGQI